MMMPGECWGGAADRTGSDVEVGNESILAKTAYRYVWIAMDVAAMCFLSAALLLAPGIFGILFCAMCWKGELDVTVHIFFTLLLLSIMCVPPCTICCSTGSNLAVSQWVRRRRWLVAVSLILGCVALVIFFMCLFYTDSSIPDLNGNYDATLPVAVVGSGPSGLAASWVLAKGGRRVAVFESAGEIGGHSKSWIEESDGRNLTIDLGFIFNNAADSLYTSYKNFTMHFNQTLRTTSLNTSGHFDGEYWDNTGDPDRFDPALREEIDRFMALVNAPQSTLRYLAPMGMWLWYHGFSHRFRRLCLDSTMAVLFVTKMGLDKQSAQSVLNHFTREGFTHLWYDAPKVQFNPGGSQFMWKEVVADMQSTGRAQVRLNSKVTAVEKEDGLWTLTLADGSRHRGFGDVVLACPANVAARIVRGRPIQTLIVSQIDYVDADVTLHTDANATVWPSFRQAADEVLYYVSDDHMTGRIGRIFQDRGSDLLLTVHGQGREALRIDPAKTKWRTTWSHHYFALFELVIARKFVPMFNGGGGLHFAGDWLYGVGHDDAIKSGVHAACAAGVPPRPLDGTSDPLYSNLLWNTCRLPA